MTKELTYETIPNEFWPKCTWCGGDLGGCTLEVKNPWGKQRLCAQCRDTFIEELRLSIPVLIREMAHLFEDYLCREDRAITNELDSIDMLNEAIQNMKVHELRTERIEEA